MKRHSLITIIGFLIIALVTISVYAETKPTNIIIIFTDDQGYQDLGVFGAEKIKTPNIDQMARDGMRFTHFYAAASVCTPSRASLLTGCYPERVGNLGVLFPKMKRGLNPKEATIAEILKSKGYATACIGKWHLGHLPEFLPTAQGFDTYFGIPYSNDMTIAEGMQLDKNIVLRNGITEKNIWKPVRNHVPLMRGTRVIEYPADQSTLTKRYTEEAVAFIKQNRDKPFFIYMPHTMPHIPLYASPKFEGKSDAGLYGDCIEEIDWSVGQIRKQLAELELTGNTLIIYTSDNGPWHFKQNATDKVKGNKNRKIGGSAKPLRGYKFEHWEGSMREPTVMCWPGQIPQDKTCAELASTIDLLPTIAAITGAPLPEKKIDGASILPLMQGQENAKSPHSAFFYRTHGVRTDRWKLIKPNPKAKAFALYDLSTDISEKTDVSKQHPEIVKQLTGLLDNHIAELETNKRPPGSAPNK
ncbi:MAG: sulfatase [Akkermansiaceae bacterium]|nr:sulfatase [Akkermansiaceae bacterium]